MQSNKSKSIQHRTRCIWFHIVQLHAISDKMRGESWQMTFRRKLCNETFSKDNWAGANTKWTIWEEQFPAWPNGEVMCTKRGAGGKAVHTRDSTRKVAKPSKGFLDKVREAHSGSGYTCPNNVGSGCRMQWSPAKRTSDRKQKDVAYCTIQKRDAVCLYVQKEIESEAIRLQWRNRQYFQNRQKASWLDTIQSDTKSRMEFNWR